MWKEPTMTREADKSCPQCKSAAAVAKVSALYYDCYSAEKDRKWLPSDSYSWSRYQLVPTEAKARKELAKRLAPPQNYATNGGEMAGVGVEAGGGILADAGIVGLIIGGVLAFILLPLALFGSSASPRLDWTAAMNRWDALYYCARCDGVFIPGQDKLVPSKKMHEFVYR
jgi:hypothetical protein